MSDFLLQEPWPPFTHGATTYDLSHLNEYVQKATVSANVERSILITFSDHCFTRDPNEMEDNAPPYPGCTRVGGRFCTKRHELSLQIRNHLDFAHLKKVWNTKQDGHYLVAKGVNQHGVQVEYAIIFSLEKSKGLQSKGGNKIDLHMRIRTAHRRDEGRSIETFGSVKFLHLIKLIIEKKRPPKNSDRQRKRPFYH